MRLLAWRVGGASASSIAIPFSLALAAILAAPAARDGAVHAQALSPVAFFERLVLTHFYRATNGPDWTDNANWLTDAPVGEWHGVAVDGEGRVTGLRLDANRLSGEIPSALANLAKLESLWLADNQLSGSIPPDLDRLTGLTELVLSRNRLSGEVPPSLGNLANLERWPLAAIC